jgi:dihydrolipoamide dehydrogenase
MENFDLAVIGAGPGGYVAAIRGAQLGLNVALVEVRSTLGGTCLNVGCIPSKVLLESSGLYHRVRNGLEEHGISAGPVEMDLGKMMARKDRVVRELTDGIRGLMKKNKVSVFHGQGVLDGPGRLQVKPADGGDPLQVEATHILLAMGSVPLEIPSLPFDGERIVSSTEALGFPRVPDHLVVLGAGAVGLELGSVWRRLGAKVTVVEMLPMITPFADRMIARTLEKALKKQGLDFRLGSRITGAELQGEVLRVSVENGKGEVESLDCDKLLVSAGRRPCVEGAGLEEAGVEREEDGRIRVDDRFRTSVPGVYAIGDLIRGPMLAHKAEEEGMAAAEEIAGRPGHTNCRVIPSVVYTHPELAQAGLTEEEAKAQGLPIKSGRFYFRANGRAKSAGEEEGLVKVLAHAESGLLLGVHIVGPCASELIAEAVTVLENEGTAEMLARTVHAHPTLSEAVKEAALAVDRRQIHM